MQFLNRDITIKKRKFSEICASYAKRLESPDNINNKIKMSKMIVKKYINISIKNNSVKWPILNNNREKLIMMRKFHHDTNYNSLERIICCVCSRYFLLHEKKSSFIHSPEYLLKFQQYLHKDLLTNIVNTDDFKYDKFNQLDDMVLNPKGFNDASVNIF